MAFDKLSLKTHITTLGVVIPHEFKKVTDPGRIAAQIVTGIGVLGAGVVLKEGFTVIGLTTAACLWIAAARLSLRLFIRRLGKTVATSG
jgi:uncharacterized membrane protein YhiD involved in acid resistance